jgi:hypothetical protein
MTFFCYDCFTFTVSRVYGLVGLVSLFELSTCMTFTSFDLKLQSKSKVIAISYVISSIKSKGSASMGGTVTMPLTNWTEAFVYSRSGSGRHRDTFALTSPPDIVVGESDCIFIYCVRGA